MRIVSEIEVEIEGKILIITEYDTGEIVMVEKEE